MFVTNLKTINMKNKQVAPTMRNMKVGDSEVYPASQKTTLESTRQRLQHSMAEKGVKFSIVKENGGKTYIVTRIS